MQGQSSMANVLLISSDADALTVLTVELREMGHVVRSALRWDITCSELEDRFSPEIIALDVTNIVDTDWPTLRGACQHWSMQPSPVLLLCWSRIWRGPRFALEIERLGARFVYGT